MVTSANTPPPKLLGPVRSLCPLVESVLRFNADSNLNLNRETVSALEIHLQSYQLGSVIYPEFLYIKV